MEEVEITTTLEIMVDSSPIMGPWRETTLVAETQVDPMVVSFTLLLHSISSHVISELPLNFI